jgi:hypothetical protein
MGGGNLSEWVSECVVFWQNFDELTNPLASQFVRSVCLSISQEYFTLLCLFETHTHTYTLVSLFSFPFLAFYFSPQRGRRQVTPYNDWLIDRTSEEVKR